MQLLFTAMNACEVQGNATCVSEVGDCTQWCFSMCCECDLIHLLYMQKLDYHNQAMWISFLKKNKHDWFVT